MKAPLTKVARCKNPNPCVRKLRTELGLQQKEFASIFGVTREAIDQAERGVEPLSVGLAKTMSVATGIDENWLLKADIEAPMKDYFGRDFSRQYFDESWDRREQKPLSGSVDLARVLYSFLLNFGTLLELNLNACKKGKFHQFTPKLFQALEKLRKEFGNSDVLRGEITKAAAELSTMKIPAGTGKASRDAARRKAVARIIRKRLLRGS